MLVNWPQCHRCLSNLAGSILWPIRDEIVTILSGQFLLTGVAVEKLAHQKMAEKTLR
jgi:hypothetical protein